MSKYVVLGVDGNFGALVADYVQRFIKKTDLVFTAPKAKPLKKYSDAGIETAVANFNEENGLVSIFENADKILLISMPFVGEKRRQAHKNVVDACVNANVKQIIYTSVLSASNPLNPSIEGLDHGYTETIIENSGLDYIILRNSLFAEAFITDYDQVIQDGKNSISKNMDDGKVAFVSRRDAVTAAACALNNNLLHREILNINGLKRVTYGKFLSIANEVTGNDVFYNKQTDDELYDYFDSIGVPRDTDGDFSNSPIKATSEGMVSFGTAIAKGFLDVAVNDFSKLTGRRPISLHEMFSNSKRYQLGSRHPTED